MTTFERAISKGALPARKVSALEISAVALLCDCAVGEEVFFAVGVVDAKVAGDKFESMSSGEHLGDMDNPMAWSARMSERDLELMDGLKTCSPMVKVTDRI